MMGRWDRAIPLPPKTYTCHHESCHQVVEATEGWPFLKDEQYEIWFIYICPQCLRPTFFDHFERQIPEATSHKTLA